MRTVALAMVVLVSSVALGAQGRGGQAPAGPPPSPQASAPIDLTGNWVAVVTEDWRWRMVTPPKGDLASVPLNAAGQKAANAWDPATDGSCQAYGAAGLMRMPGRLRITWENDRTLKIETDAGLQTRRLMFGESKPPAQRSLQGYTVAEWEVAGGGGRGRGGPPPTGPRPGNLKATTTMMSGGWLRRNGVPYSQNATLTEYFDRFRAPNGDEWLAVTSIVSDPQYLNQDFVTSSHFKKEADGSKWAPRACK
jgi:hypothetical protein